jgi:hypothetical protein
MRISEAFQQWLRREPAPWSLGQVVILPAGEDRYELRHREDCNLPVENLRRGAGLEPVRDWVRRAADGTFRPLKAGNNLARGWSAGPYDVPVLIEALNALYPTALANAFLHREGKLRITPFAETAGRQTGMYRIVATLSEEQKAKVVCELCAARCLKQRLWNGEDAVAPPPSELPLLCPEACNLFVAEGRAVLKGRPAEGHE